MADLETVHDTFDHTGLTGVGGGITLATCLIRRASNQDVSGSGTATKISYSDEDNDADGCWAVGTPTDIIIPAGLNTRKGIIYAHVVWRSAAGGSFRRLNIFRDGTEMAGCTVPNVNVSIHMSVRTPVITFATGQVFDVRMTADAASVGVFGGAIGINHFGLVTVD